MKKVNIYEEPLAFNICDQMLREMERTHTWTMAHVLMNPKADSLLHAHRVMREAYIITRGSGRLIVGSKTFSVQAGDVVCIPSYHAHKLTNTGGVSLEHLVLATPPFDPKDVYVDELWDKTERSPVPFLQPDIVECFDGAKIIPYQIDNLVSVAFGWVINDPSRYKPAHHHKKTTEWIYVVEGKGYLELNGVEAHPIKQGDWICVKPGEWHALRNHSEQHMVVACICYPCFSMDDVYF